MLHKKALYFKLLAALTALAASPVIATAAAGGSKGITEMMSAAANQKDVVPVMSGSFPLEFQRESVKSGITVADGAKIIVGAELPDNPRASDEAGADETDSAVTTEQGSDETDFAAETSVQSDPGQSGDHLGLTEPVEDTPSVLEDEPAAAVISRNISDTQEDLSVFTAKDGVVRKVSYQPIIGTDYIDLAGGGQVRNMTTVDPAEISAQSALLPDMTLLGDGSPEILIVHTHTTEAFQPTDSDTYDRSYQARCFDPEQSIVAVGTAIAEQLAAAGFGVIHDGTIHDSPVYDDAYARSADVIRQTIAEYPTIKVVLDIHRDAIADSDALIAPVVSAEGKDAAQVMIIAAVDSPDYPVPNFWQNFRFASLLQQQFEADAPGITRPILFDYCQYNEQITPGSLLIEVGAHGNSLDQAVYAGEIVGGSIAQVLNELKAG